jgi:hypothetical protein
MKRYYLLLYQRSLSKILFVLYAAFFVPAFIATASAADLKTEPAKPSEVQGTFTVMLYGCNGESDVNDIVLLQKEGENKPFGIDPPAFDYAYYGVERGIEGKEALRKAQQFLACSAEPDHIQLSRIVDSEGTILGFELKPQYRAAKYGAADSYFTRYTEDDDAITVQMIPNLDIGNKEKSGD